MFASFSDLLFLTGQNKQWWHCREWQNNGLLCLYLPMFLYMWIFLYPLIFFLSFYSGLSCSSDVISFFFVLTSITSFWYPSIPCNTFIACYNYVTIKSSFMEQLIEGCTTVHKLTDCGLNRLNINSLKISLVSK